MAGKSTPGSPDGGTDGHHAGGPGQLPVASAPYAPATAQRPAPHEPATGGSLPRFSTPTRAFHWVHAVPFLFLLISGLVILIVPEVKALHVGGHRLVPFLHVLVGIGFIAGVPLLYVGIRDRRALHDDLRLAFTPERGDGAWARYAVYALLGARLRQPPVGKFNLGQKLSSVFWTACTLGLMATGAVLAVNYFTRRVVGADLVERVFTWHDLLMIVSLPVLAAHLYLALVNPGTRPSLRGMVTGRVDAAWARLHHSRWAAAVEAPEDPMPPPAPRDT